MATVDGLVSGLDTTSIVNQLMQLNAAPQTRLKTTLTKTQGQVLALQSVNTAMAGLQSAADKLALGSSWAPAQATSSSPSVVATSGSGATSGSTTFSVTRLAAAQSTVSNETFTSLTDTSTFSAPDFEIRRGTGADEKVMTVKPAEGSLQSLINAVNSDPSLGVRAAAVQVSTGVYRLQLTATETGTANAFSFTAAGGGPPSGVSLRTVAPAADAVLRVGDATSGFDITSSSNTVEGVMPGLTVKVSALATDVTISTARDNAAVTASVKALVDSANAALGSLKNQTTQGTTNASGSRTGAGALAGDSATRALGQRIISLVSGGVGGASLSFAGISTTREGAITFDADVFAKALAKDPAKVKALFSNAVPAVAETATSPAVAAVPGNGLADALAKVGRDTSGPAGSIAAAIAGRTSTIKDLGDRISSWDTRLASQKAALQRQYASLETALGKLKSQSTWLAGQLNALSSGSES
ncbi:MAG TPA: flagellar filament capping protein FliD [Actinomycetales bacterium]|jgi:flagellar hook-associated protein 2